MNLRISKQVWKNALFFALFSIMIASALGAGAIEFINPITSGTLEALIDTLASGILKLVMVLAPVFIVITGFRFLVAASTGNQAGLATAKKLFFWTLIGTAIIVGASVIAKAIINFAKGL